MLDRPRPLTVLADDATGASAEVLAGGAIHDATLADVPALVALLHVAGGEGAELGVDDVHALVRDGHFLVLARTDGRLAGCVHVQLGHRVGHVRYLAIDPGLPHQALADRLLGVAGALCDAYQCTRG